MKIKKGHENYFSSEWPIERDISDTKESLKYLITHAVFKDHEEVLIKTVIDILDKNIGTWVQEDDEEIPF